MGPRIYPSYQDTNTTTNGSLILSMDVNLDYIDIYVNNQLTEKNYSDVQGLYSIKINNNDVVRFENSNGFSIDLSRIDYTTYYENGDDGLKRTYITGITNTTSYTFTAQTISADYNFEYGASIGVANGPTGYKGTMIFTYKTSVTKDLSSGTFDQKYFWIQGFHVNVISPTALFLLSANTIEFTGTTSTTQNLGYFPLTGQTNNPILGAITTEVCYTGLTGGIAFQGGPEPCKFEIYVNNILQSSATYTSIDNGFGLVRPCDFTGLSQTFVSSSFNCNDGDIVEYVFEDNFFIQDNTPTPTPTPILPTSTPTPTPTVTPTPTPTPTPNPIEGQYMLAVKSDNLVYRSSDFGVNWTQVTGFTTGMTVTDTAISETGQYQVITVYNGAIYVSTNYGATFSANGANDTYIACAISSNGQYINAITDTIATRKLRWSTNYGLSFPSSYSLIGQTPTDCSIDNSGNAYISFRSGIQKFVISTNTMSTLYSSSSINWTGVTSSGDGTKVATSRGNTVAYTLNGTTFSTVNSANVSVNNITSSRDGRYLKTYSTSNLSNSKSSNSAVSWTSESDIGYPAISNTGAYQALAYGDNIKLSSNYGSSYSTVFTLSGANWKNISMNK